MSSHLGVLLEHSDHDGHLLLYMRNNISYPPPVSEYVQKYPVRVRYMQGTRFHGDMTIEFNVESTYQDVYAALVTEWRTKEYPWSYMYDKGHCFGDRRCYMPDTLKMFLIPRDFPPDDIPCVNALVSEGGGLRDRLAMLEWEGILQDVEVGDLRPLLECFDLLIIPYDTGRHGIQYSERRTALGRVEFVGVRGERVPLDEALKDIVAIVQGSISRVDVERHLLSAMESVTGVVLWPEPLDIPPPEKHASIRENAGRMIDAMQS
jgi:hypothetical protein